MPQSKVLMLNQATTGPGTSHTFHPHESNRGFVVSVGGVAAAVSAVVIIEVSSDQGVTWAERLRFSSLAGTSTLTAPIVNSDVDPNGPFPNVRANVISVTGGGLVTASCTAATSGMGAV